MRAKFINKINEEQQYNLTTGQDYAIKYMSSIGLKLISSINQLNKGNLIFEDKYKIKWGIFATGYIRKFLLGRDRWQVIDRIKDPQYINKGKIDDEEYKELAEMLARRVLSYHKKINYTI